MRLTQFFFLDAMIEEDRLSLKFRNRFNPSLFPILTCWYWLFYFILLMLFVFLHYGWKGICGGRLLLVIGEGSTVLSNSLLKVHFFSSHMTISLNLPMASFSANSIAFFWNLGLAKTNKKHSTQNHLYLTFEAIIFIALFSTQS